MTPSGLSPSTTRAATTPGIGAYNPQVRRRVVRLFLGDDANARLPGDLRHSSGCQGGGRAASESLLGLCRCLVGASATATAAAAASVVVVIAVLSMPLPSLLCMQSL